MAESSPESRIEVGDSWEVSVFGPVVQAEDDGGCRVYWGSHGCLKARGHRGRHRCDCTPGWMRLVPSRWRRGYVGAHPFYGPGTNFYGEDASRG